MTKKRLLSYAQHGGSRKSGQLFSLSVIVLLIGIHVRHLHIYNDAHYFPQKFCITIDFHFSWVLQQLQPSQEKLKTMLIYRVARKSIRFFRLQFHPLNNFSEARSDDRRYVCGSQAKIHVYLTLYCFYTKICCFKTVLTRGTVRDCSYLLIFYSEKF